MKDIMKVNNRKCIYWIAGRCLLSNRRRNMITIAAIILTAILFTSLFTIMLSINASYETSIFRQIGGYVHGTFKDVTASQEAKLINHKNIKAYGERMILGVNEDETFRNQSAEISFMDDNAAKWFYIELEEGHMPVDYHEVIMDKEALRLLGYEPALGEQIELSFNINSSSEEQSKYQDTFTLVGYWEFDTLAPAHYINVSKEYAEDFAKKIEELGYEPIRTDLNVMLSSLVGAWDKMMTVIEDCGYTCGKESTDESIRIGINPGYTMVSVDGDWDEVLGILIPMAAFLLLVIFTGYLIIFNVFQISVVSDIRFYGLLKTIGTTQKQVRKVIRLQALTLCVAGIPAGLFFGYLLGAWLTPAVLKTTTVSGNSLTISASPIVFIASGFLEMVTVMISVIRPGRTAGKVSPIEALRYTDGMAGVRKKKKSTKGARVVDMAFANMGRNKKKTLIVFVSLALSIVVLNTVNMFVGGFDSEKWLESYMSTDFVVGKYTYFKFQGAGQNSISEAEILPIKENVDAENGGFAYDVTGIPLMKVSEESYKEYRSTQPGAVSNLEAENGMFYMDCFIEGMDDFLIDKLDVCEGDVSLLGDRNSRYIALITYRGENGEYLPDANAPKVGDRISIAEATGIELVDTRTGEPATEATYETPEYLAGTYTGIKEYEYTVCAYVEVPNDISQRRATLGYDAIVGADMLLSDFGDSVVPLFYAFDTDSPESEEKAESFQQKYCEENSGITYESKAVNRAEFDGFKKMFILLGGVLCLIIGFVGILNFFNTVMAGIITRKNELAVLQAIGMTGKQVKEMLITEGLIYTAGSGLIAFLLSLIFVPVINTVADRIFGFYSDHFSITPVVMMMPIMALLGVVVPLLSYRGLSKASIVDRIREVG